MAVIPGSKAKTAHVNVMTDIIIANLPADALRSVVRAILTTEPSITNILEEQTQLYLRKTVDEPVHELFSSKAEGIHPTSNFKLAQQRLRSAIGCGMVLESFPILRRIVDESIELNIDNAVPRSVELDRCLSAIDGDIVQASTAVQKRLSSDSGSRSPNQEEMAAMTALFNSLLRCRQRWLAFAHGFPFERSTSALATMLGRGSDIETLVHGSDASYSAFAVRNDPVALEAFKIKDLDLPRLFSGLWQLSSHHGGSRRNHRCSSNSPNISHAASLHSIWPITTAMPRSSLAD